MTLPDSTEAAISSASNVSPEESSIFRQARLLLLFAVAREHGRQIASLDRLAYYEFFSDSPWIVVSNEDGGTSNDKAELAIAGFSPRQLSYASTGQRFASRRERIRVDLAQLVAYGLVELDEASFVISDRGRAIANDMQSSYAEAYRTSAAIVLRRLARMSNKSLEASVESWLGHSWLLIDLLDDVKGAELSGASQGAEDGVGV